MRALTINAAIAVRDAHEDIHTDPNKIHEIDHNGTWFQVPGPHMCEPSLQRTPVLFQAGQSGRGMAFAGRHAEAIFGIWPHIEACKKNVDKTRAVAVEQGREPDQIKIFAGMTVVVGATDAEAQAKYASYLPCRSPEGALALFSGWIGYDLSRLDPARSLDEIRTDAIQGLMGYFSSIDPNKRWTVEDIGEFVSIGSIMPKIIGSPRTVVDGLERWFDDAGSDGINLAPVVQPSGFTISSTSSPRNCSAAAACGRATTRQRCANTISVRDMRACRKTMPRINPCRAGKRTFDKAASICASLRCVGDRCDPGTRKAARRSRRGDVLHGCRLTAEDRGHEPRIRVVSGISGVVPRAPASRWRRRLVALAGERVRLSGDNSDSGIAGRLRAADVATIRNTILVVPRPLRRVQRFLAQLRETSASPARDSPCRGHEK
mgnify:CR=1 FL=1|jgi:alkanesulfonate monooxygenase SsuD/methylene tetrahydromethanopterin reductase-like flavin-dependent oxidoreductase (luciferase family)